MKKTAIALAITASIIETGQASASSASDRISAMENRIQYLEQRVQSQDEVIKNAHSNTDSWIENIEMAGLVEVEAGTTSPENGPDESNITVATVELALTSTINDWTEVELVLLYEDSGATKLNVDSATITIASPDSNWSVTAGHMAIPFGVFETHLVSDPLTLEIGETFEDIIMAGINNGAISAGAYIFNGDIDNGDDEVKSFGAYLDYTIASDRSAFAVSLGYINNIGDTDGISAINNNTGSIAEHVAGMSLALNYSTGPLNVIAEYLGATDDFAANTLAMTSAVASPSATSIEAAYNFDMSGKEATVAISVQGTDEAEDIGLPESKTLLGLSIGIMKNISLAFEFITEEDYIGIETDAITAQLAVAF